MQISFFEEFPTKKNLSRLGLVPWATKLYIAAPGFGEFMKLWPSMKRKNIRKINIKEVIYWPTLTKDEGYWISPFSRRSGLQRIFRELHNKSVPLMLDLELPTTQNPSLYFTQSLNFIRNRRLIKKFIREYRGDIYAAEYFPEGKAKEKFLSWWGLHYLNKKIKVIKMAYHSMHNFSDDWIERELKKGKQQFGKRFLVAYGVLKSGQRGDEPSIKPEVLESDLRIAQDGGIEEVVVYRLGGLNRTYAKILKRYASEIPKT